ncbi:DNA-processing protein DprA [Bacillus gaemokensis]|uniref:DNA-binding protein n=1 Tax=Bacillus gaemokensis TaxID=574375 RepID=A0A073KH52_9BACI|nr:DNA-processing protein DprA [Bacillus gaemokensis]KEK25762.1 DNA-binding protein [Bacillus gaemokensis]KYG38578.1 DNA processing protein DprA [Bacillus gaemokensis]
MKKERLLHLHYMLADYWKALNRLLQLDPELKELYNFGPKQFEKYAGLTPKASSELAKFLQKSTPSECIRHLEKNQNFYVTIWDEDYPKLLREIPDPPFILYGKGKRELLSKVKKYAVVGTRKPSLYGKDSIQSILRPLIDEGWVIVSGFASGIDTFAHEVTVQRQSPTIAVLGHGLQYMYPKENNQFYNMWKEHMLLLTEYPSHYPPRKWYFPKRNRIISGLCQGILVVEAKAKSGSLITADLSLEQNREVFALPGPIFTESAAGTNQLIQQGAKLVQKAEDILEEFLN